MNQREFFDFYQKLNEDFSDFLNESPKRYPDKNMWLVVETIKGIVNGYDSDSLWIRLIKLSEYMQKND